MDKQHIKPGNTMPGNEGQGGRGKPVKAPVAPSDSLDGRFRDMVESINDVIYKVRLDGTITYVSQAIERIIGFTPSELYPINLFSLIIEEDRAKALEAFAYMENPRNSHFEFRIHHKDGSVRWVRTSAVPLYEGGVLIGGTGALSSIAEMKEMQERLLESESRFRGIFEASNDGMLIFDQDTRKFLMGNDKICQMLGYSPDEIPNLGIGDIHDEEGIRAIIREFRRKRRGKTSLLESVRIRRKDGSVFYAEVSAAFATIGGKTYNIAGLRDITRRRQAQEMQDRLNREINALSLCNQAMLRATDEQELLNEICRIVCDEVGYKLAWVGYKQDDENRSVKPMAWGGDHTDYVSKLHISWSDESIYGTGPSGMAIRTGKSVCVQEVATDPRVKVWRDLAIAYGYHSSIALPLKDESGAVFGTFQVYGDKPHVFTRDEESLLERLAGDLAYGINTLRARQERLRVQEQLLQSEEMYRNLVESMNDIIYEIDNQGVITYMSPVFEKVAGYAIQEVIGRNFLSLIHADDRPWLMEYLQKSDEIRYDYIEFRGITKDGDIRWFHSKPRSIRKNGEVTGKSGVMVDITQQKRAEEALRESEEALNDAQELAGLGNWETDLKSGETIWSRNFSRLFGIPSNVKPSYELLRKYIHPEDLLKSDKIYATEVKLKAAVEFEHRIVLPEQKIRWLKHIVKPVIRKGKMTGIKGSVIDYTATKEKEFQIRMQNDRLRAMMQATPDLVFINDKNGVCREYFTNGSNKTFLPEDQVVGSDLNMVFGENAGFHLEKITEALTTGNLVTYEYTMPNGNDTDYYESRLRPFGEDVLVFTRDITENRKANRQIRILSQAMEQSPISIVVTDLKGRIEYVNPWFAHLTGYTEEELIGNNPRVLKSGRHNHDFYADLWREIRNGRLWKGQIQNRKKNGEFYWESAIIAPVKNEYGEITNFIGLKEDITDKVKSEQLLKESIFTRDRLFSIIAHDLRGPIGNLIPMIEMVAGDYAKDEAMRAELLSDMRKAAINTFDLLENLLNWARFQSNAIDVKPSNFNLAEVIHDIVELYSSSANLKSIRIDKKLDNTLTVHADIDSLKLVVRNLLYNSIKFTPRNGVITLSAYSQGTDVFVEIADNGVGMTPEVVANLFKTDFSHSTYGTNYEKGSGLGLMLCKEFVEKNGGTIHVESKLGEGSRFVFSLARGHAESSRPEAIREIDSLAPGLLEGRSILLVEDDPFSQLYGKTLLQQWKVKGDVASNGENAVEMVRNNDYDLILMDLEMPGMDGFSAIDMIQNQLGKRMPVIAVSASISNRIIRKAFESGFRDYVIKPGKPDELYSKVVYWLGIEPKDSTPGIPDTPVIEKPEETLQCSDVDKLRKAMGNDATLTKMMLMKFLEVAPGYAGEMQTAWADGDFEKLRQVSHKLKSSVTMLANDEIAGKIKEINEYAGNSELHAHIPRMMEEFNVWFPKLHDEITSELSNM